MFIFLDDTRGNVFLIKGTSGEIIGTKKIGSNSKSSPIVVENKIILGSRDNKIYKIALNK